MKFTYAGKDFVISDRLKEQSGNKLSRLDKYLNEDADCRVVFSETPTAKVCEVTIFLKGGTVLRAEEEEDDVYSAVDRAIDALESQLRKHKTKLQKRHGGKTIRFDNIEDIPEKEEGPKIVKVKSFGLKPMDSEEAILQMELLTHNFFVFLNRDTDEVNVIYRRKDGDYGLIEPYI
ncbi:MAG: ribosome-associated translation inhibitor RaiA [Tissierellia bacterium]|nr:ribosome-associated translation inhibitor RaiA [Tissierellia bacterium]